MTQILITKPGALNADDRAALRLAGVVAVEAESPNDVKLISASGEELGGSAILYAAMRALNTEKMYAGDARQAFAKAVMDELQSERNIHRGALVEVQPRGPGGRFAKKAILKEQDNGK